MSSRARRTRCRTARERCARSSSARPKISTFTERSPLGWRRDERSELAMFPLGMVVFPHQVVGLCVFEIALPADARATSRTIQRFGTCLIARGSEVGGGDERTVGGHGGADPRLRSDWTTARPSSMVEGVSCFEVTTWLEDEPYPRAIVEERCCDDVIDRSRPCSNRPSRRCAPCVPCRARSSPIECLADQLRDGRRSVGAQLATVFDDADVDCSTSSRCSA